MTVEQDEDENEKESNWKRYQLSSESGKNCEVAKKQKQMAGWRRRLMVERQLPGLNYD